MVQYLRLCTPSAGGPGSIPGQETNPYMLHWKISHADLRPGLPLSVPSPRCGRHCHCHTPVPRRGPRQLHLQHLCPALQHSLREWYQGHGPGEARLAELGWVQVLGTRALSERNRPAMAVGARWGLNLPLLTPLIRNSSSATWPWDGVWTSRLLPEGEPVCLSKVFSPFLGETSS